MQFFSYNWLINFAIFSRMIKFTIFFPQFLRYFCLWQIIKFCVIFCEWLASHNRLKKFVIFSYNGWTKFEIFFLTIDWQLLQFFFSTVDRQISQIFFLRPIDKFHIFSLLSRLANFMFFFHQLIDKIPNFSPTSNWRISQGK